MAIEVPLLGVMKRNSDFPTWLESEPIPVPLLGGLPCTIVLERYESDDQPQDFHDAIANLLAATPQVLRDVEKEVYQYYLDCDCNIYRDEEDWIVIEKPEDVWQFVDLGKAVYIARNQIGDEVVYASIENNCEWEDEHGLQIVLREGLRVTKLGPFDGHLTNSDAVGEPDVIYSRVGWHDDETD